MSLVRVRRGQAASLMLTLLAMPLLLGADGPILFSPKPEVAADLPLLLNDDFDHSRLDLWDFTDPNAWTLTTADGNTVLEQKTASKYEPRVRSPLNIALSKKVDVSDFVLDLKVKSTARDYGHRDVCLFFGHQDPSHFYYVHLGKVADPHAHSIFLVNGAPRVSIAAERTTGTPWTEGWHHVRVVRKVGDGSVLVYFDDMKTPVMKATDTTFARGRIGVGTFDDTAQFDAVQLWGKKAK